MTIAGLLAVWTLGLVTGGFGLPHEFYVFPALGFPFLSAGIELVRLRRQGTCAGILGLVSRRARPEGGRMRPPTFRQFLSIQREPARVPFSLGRLPLLEVVLAMRLKENGAVAATRLVGSAGQTGGIVPRLR